MCIRYRVATVQWRGLRRRVVGGCRRDHASDVVHGEEEWVSVDQRQIGNAGIRIAGAPGCALGKALHCAVVDVGRSVAVAASSVRTPSNVGVALPLLVVLPPVHESALPIVVKQYGGNKTGVGPCNVAVPLFE